MSLVIYEYDSILSAPNGEEYRARVCGGPNEQGLWEGWIEFIPIDGGALLATARETTQPNRTDLEYWATGLSAVYLEGAFGRTPEYAAPNIPPTAELVEPAAPAVLNPFAAYGKGEELLRRQLSALDTWQLQRILSAYAIADPAAPAIRQMSRNQLAELIIVGVRERLLSHRVELDPAE